MKKLSTYLGLFVGAALGLTLAFWPDSDAARNASGTYVLPAGNPVVPGTVITASWANTTLADLGVEVTNSLDRQGRGGMLASLRLPNGTATAPSLAWTSETNSGLYRPAAADIRMQVGGTQVQRWNSTGVTFPLGATLAGAVTTTAGLTATNSTLNAAAITATGNGTGQGVLATGGGASGDGLVGMGGATNGTGVRGTGVGTGYGGYFTGGPSSGIGVAAFGPGYGGFFTGDGVTGVGVSGTGFGPNVGGIFTGGAGGGHGISSTGGATSGVGVDALGGAPDGIGVRSRGTGSGPGGQFFGGATSGTGISGSGGGGGAGGTFANGTAAIAGTRRDAIVATNGDLSLDGVANPTTSVAVKNRVTPANIIKAFGYITAGTATPTINAGFNLSSLSCAASEVTVQLSQAMATGNYAIVITEANASARFYASLILGASSFRIDAFSAGGALVDLCSVAAQFSFMVIGAQ